MKKAREGKRSKKSLYSSRSVKRQHQNAGSISTHSCFVPTLDYISLVQSRFSAPSWLVGKAVRNYSVCIGIRWPRQPFPRLNFTQFMNHNVKILSRRLYSPSLKDVSWLERAQLIFLIFHTFVCKFGRVEGAHGKKNYRKMYGEVGKINWAPSIQPTFFKLWCSLQGLQMSKAP